MTERGWRGAWVALLLMGAVSLAVRLHNVAVYPDMRAPDGFGHFTYIWHLASTGTIPLATQGWSFFHPPLYYAWMAWVWNSLPSLDGATRLQVGTAVIAAAGLVHAAVAFALVRRRFPGRAWLAVAAAGFLLFLPVQLYSAGYLGNEALNAVLCSLALAATLRLLERPSAARALVLGMVLGLAMLTKFTSLAIVAGAFASIAVSMLVRGSVRRGLPLAALAGAVALATCGWFYLRNVEVYGTPFQMSRDTLAVRRVENMQSQGRRGPAEFLLFDPMVVVRPQWPRGIPLTAAPPFEFDHSSLRESVWTGMFANTFFDAVGGQVLPYVTDSNESRRAGQVLLALGLVPTALVLAGILAALGRLLRGGWNDVDGTVLLCFVSTIALFAIGVKSVPMNAAVKATYLAPAGAMFAYWLASGLDVLDRRLPPLRLPALAACAGLALASVVVFTLGMFVSRGFLSSTRESAVWQNLQGIVAYAAGDREQARRSFERSAVTGWYLAQENLAALALEDGQVLESLYRMRLAARMQPVYSTGLPKDREDFDRATQAEYRNSIGAAYYELGWIDDAEPALREAAALDASIPETSFDLGIVEMTRALEAADERARAGHERAAAAAFAKAAELDPGFVAAAALASCTGTEAPKTSAAALNSWTPRRSYPVETMTGDQHASALQRRRHITRLRADLRDALARRDCLPEL